MLRPLVIAAFALSGCSTANQAPECNVGGDCPSGACRADGTCVPAADGGDTTADAPTNDQDGAPPSDAPLATTDGPPAVCATANGTIERAEVPTTPGLSISYLVANGVTVDLVGTDVDGVRTWDLSGPFAGGSVQRLPLSPPDEFWFDSDFPNATYVATIPGIDDVLGVFQGTADAIQLIGVASQASGATQTRLSYSPPIPFVQFPLRDDDSWTQLSTVAGTATGVPSTYLERYTITADATGNVITPLGTFAVKRLRTELTRTVGAFIFTRRTYTFVSECGGVVASVASAFGESEVEFTAADEVRSVSP